MSALEIVTAAALSIWLGAGAYVFGATQRLRLDQRAEARARVEQGRDVDAAWLARLATEPTPIYDALVCESMERAECWA